MVSILVMAEYLSVEVANQHVRLPYVHIATMHAIKIPTAAQ